MSRLCANCKYNTPFTEFEKPSGSRYWDSWCDLHIRHQVYSGCWCFNFEQKEDEQKQLKITGW